MKRRKLLKKTKTLEKLTIKKMVVLVIKFLANSFIFWGLHFERFLFEKGGVATPTYICRANGSARLHKIFLYLTQDFEFLHTIKMLMF